MDNLIGYDHMQWCSQVGACGLATRGCASLVDVYLKIIGAKHTVVNHKFGAKVHKDVKSSCAVYM